MPPRLFFRWLGLGMVALLGAGLLGEAAVRTLGLVDRLNGYPRRLYVATTGGLPYALRPGMDVDVRGARVRTNALGLRGPEIEPAPTAGRRRVLLVGDSVAFGYRVPEAETLAVQLEAELGRRSGAPWQLVNGGVEGYDTRAELAFLRQTGFGLAPETIVLVFNLNDFDAPPVIGPGGVLTNERVSAGCSDALAQVSEFHLLLRWLSRSGGGLPAPAGPATIGGSGGAAPAFGELDRFVSALRKNYWRQPSDGRREAMVESLRSMREESTARGIRLVVAISPDGDQLGVAAPDLTPQWRLATICRELGLECLDLRETFAAQGGTEPLFLDITHPSAAGLRIMADAIAARILDSASAQLGPGRQSAPDQPPGSGPAHRRR